MIAQPAPPPPTRHAHGRARRLARSAGPSAAGGR